MEYKITHNEKEDPTNNGVSNIRKLLDSGFQGVKRLFVLTYDDSTTKNEVKVNSYKKYFIPKVNVEKYNIGIDGRNFYDQSINDPIKEYHEVRITAIEQGDNCT